MKKQYELDDVVYAVRRFEFFLVDFPNIMTGVVTGKKIHKGDIVTQEGKIEYNCKMQGRFIESDDFLFEELHDSKEKAIIAIEDEYKKWVIETQEKIDKKKQELGIR